MQKYVVLWRDDIENSKNTKWW